MATHVALTLSSLLALVTATVVAQKAKVTTPASIVVVPGKASTLTPTTKPMPTPAPVPTIAPEAVDVREQLAPVQLAPALPPLDLSDMQLWNWSGKWHASEWANGMSTLPWKYDHITQPARADTFFKLDAAGAPELQAMGGTPVYSRGLWESDVTLPQLKEGLVVAPLWIWDNDSRDEVDFEFVGRRGLDVTLHANLNGAMQQNTVRLFAGHDMSGERHRFGIKADAAGGYIEMYMDGQRVQRWDRKNMAFFVSHPMKPMISMWAADPSQGWLTNWTGTWTGLAPNEVLTMNVHGYKYSPLS